MKVGTKLVSGFLAVACIAAIIGAIGYFNIHKLDAADTFLYKKCTVPLGQMSDIIQGFERSVANLNYLALEKREDAAYLKLIDNDLKQIDDALNGYKKTLIDADDERNYSQMVTEFAAHAKYAEQMKALAHAGKFG